MKRGLGVVLALSLGSLVACTTGSVDEEDAGGGSSGTVRRDAGFRMQEDGGKSSSGGSGSFGDDGGVDAGDRPRRDGGESSSSSTGGTGSSMVGPSSSGGGASSTASSSSGGGTCVPDALEANDTPANAVAVSTGNYDATICPQDVDYFRVTLAATQTLTVTATFEHSRGDLNLYAYQADGTPAGSSTTMTGTETVMLTAQTAGAYYVAVRAAGAAVSNSYRLQVTLGPPPTGGCSDDALEPNDSVMDARSVGAGSLDGRICPSDPDFYRVELNVGDRLDVTVTYTQANGDLDVEVLNLAGTTLGASTLSTGTETVAVTATASGPHFVRVFGRGTAEGTYRVQLSVSPATGGCMDDGQEQNDSNATATAVGPGTIRAVVCNGDDDFYALDANAGDTLGVTLTPAGGAPNLDVELIGPGGNVVRAGTAMGADTFTVTASTSGRHVVRVFSPASITQAASYDLVLTRTPATGGCSDDALEDNDSRPSARSLAAGNHNATLCPADDDFYKLTLAAGDQLSATVTFASGLDVDLYVLNSTGTVLGSATTGATSQNVAITAASAGDYIIRVAGAVTAAAAYQLTVAVTPAMTTCVDDAFEDNDTSATARTVTPGTQAARTCAGDEDFYGVVLNVGDQLTASISFSSAAGDLDMVLFAPDGSVLAQSDGVTGTETVNTTAATAGTYVVRVFAYDNSELPYDLTTAVVPAAPTCTDDSFENNDTQGTAATLGSGTFNAQVCTGDDDFYAVTLNAQDTLKVDVTFTHANGDLDLRVLNAAGTQVASSTGTTGLETITYLAPTAGTYTIRVYGYSGAQNSYALMVRVDPFVPACTDDAREQNDSAAASSTITAGNLTGMRACPQDEDFYGINVVTGDTLNVALTTSTTGQNLDVQLLDANGAVLAAGTGTTGNETVNHVATAPGRITIRVFGGTGAGADYALNVTVTPAAPTCTDDAQEQNDTAATARTVTAQTYNVLQICPNDDDFYAIDVPAGATLTATINFTHSMGDLDLALLDGTGAVVSTSASVNNQESVTVTPAAAGRYTMRVYGFRGVGNTYSLTVALTGLPPTCTDDNAEENDSATAAYGITPGTRSGTICPSDLDFYALDLGAGDSLTVNLRFTDANGDLDLRLRDNAGALLASSSGVTDLETVTYVATTAGRYIIEVRGFLTATNSYTLETVVTPPVGCTDDAEEQNDTATAAKAIPATGAALKVCPNDDDWYSIAVTAGETLDITVAFTHASGDLDARLYDSDRTTLLDLSTGSTAPETLSWVAATSRTVYVRVSGVAGAQNNYTLSWTRTLPSFTCPADDTLEQNDNREGATILARGTPRVAQICANDEDWFAVGLETGDALTVDMTPNNGAGDLDLYLINPAGNTAAPLAQSRLSGNAAERVTYTATAPATYFVRVTGYLGSANRYAVAATVVPGSTGTCQEDAREENDSRTQAAGHDPSHLAFPSDTVGAQVCPNDEDWYDQYVFSDETWELTLKYDQGLGDLDMYVVDDTGAQVAQSLGVTGTETISYAPTASGYYYVRIRGFSGAFGPYTLLSNVR